MFHRTLVTGPFDYLGAEPGTHQGYFCARWRIFLDVWGRQDDALFHRSMNFYPIVPYGSKRFGRSGKKLGLYSTRAREDVILAREVRIVILSLRSDKPRHGYYLLKELESRSGGSYRESAG